MSESVTTKAVVVSDGTSSSRAKRRAIGLVEPFLHVPAALLSESVTTEERKQPQRAASSRAKRRAVQIMKSSDLLPAVTLSEFVTTESAPLPQIRASSRAKRRATYVAESNPLLPAATISGSNAGADEAGSPASTNSHVPRRQSSRASGEKKATVVVLTKSRMPSSQPSRARKRGADLAIYSSRTRRCLPDSQSSDRANTPSSPEIGMLDQSRSDHATTENQSPSVAAASSIERAHDNAENQHARSPLGRSDHSFADNQIDRVAAATHLVQKDEGDDGAQSHRETHSGPSPVIAVIVNTWRLRQAWWKAELALILRAQGRCRAWTDGDKTEASKLFAKIRDGGECDPTLLRALEPYLAAMEHFRGPGEAYEKTVAKLAMQLPVWKSWAENVWGLSALGLGKIVGECGDVGSYRNPSCVWKRMGLAVIGDKRQRRVSDKDEALIHGYSPQRRSVMWNIGNSLIGGMGKGVRPLVDEDWPAREDWHPYQKLYVWHLSKDAKANPEVHARPPTAAGKMSFSKHAHNRAKRFVEKRMLRHLWVAWRAADRCQVVYEPQKLVASVGSDNSENAAERCQDHSETQRSRASLGSDNFKNVAGRGHGAVDIHSRPASVGNT